MNFAGRAQGGHGAVWLYQPGLSGNGLFGFGSGLGGRAGKNRLEYVGRPDGKIKETARTRGFLLPEGETDPTRLAIGTLPLGMTGEEAAQWFRERGIEPEHEDGAYVVFIATPWNREEELTRLEMAVAQFPGEAQPVSPAPALPPLPPVRCSPGKRCWRPGTAVIRGSRGAHSRRGRLPLSPWGAHRHAWGGSDSGMRWIPPGIRLDSAFRSQIKRAVGFGFRWPFAESFKL